MVVQRLEIGPGSAPDESPRTDARSCQIITNSCGFPSAAFVLVDRGCGHHVHVNLRPSPAKCSKKAGPTCTDNTRKHARPVDQLSLVIFYPLPLFTFVALSPTICYRACIVGALLGRRAALAVWLVLWWFAGPERSSRGIACFVVVCWAGEKLSTALSSNSFVVVC